MNLLIKLLFIKNGKINWYGDANKIKKTHNVSLNNFINGKID